MVPQNPASTMDLLRQFAEILDELKRRGVLRTRNNPVADYCEWLVSNKLGFTLRNNSNSGYDAIDEAGIRYQIKGRRIDSTNPSRQLGVLRNLGAKDFDFLIAVIFNRDFTVAEAYKIPIDTIPQYSRFSVHQNGDILILRGGILNDSQVEDIKLALC